MRRDALQDILIAIILFVGAVWYTLDYVPLTVFHRDEARWLHRSYFLEKVLRPADPLWRTDTLLTLGQPPLGNYLMGIGLLAQGRELRPNGFYDFYHNEAWNRARGNIPPLPDLHAGRRTNAVVGGLTVVCVYGIGRRLANRVAGVVGALILIPHPLNTYLSTFAGSDALLVFLVAAAGLAAIALADRPSWPRAILLGVLLGLGGATKLSPLLLSLPLAALGLALLLHNLPTRLSAGLPNPRRLVTTIRRSPGDSLRPAADRSAALPWMLITLPAVAFATFVLVYPYLWADPIGRTKLLFDFRSAEMQAQGELFDQAQVTGALQAIERVRYRLGVETSTSAWLAAEFQERFNLTWNRPAIDLNLGALGLALLIIWALMYGPRSRYTLAAIVIAGEAAVIIASMQVDFNRYHLPILLAIVVGVGFLVGQLWNGLAGAALALVARRQRTAVTAPVAALAPGPEPGTAGSGAAALAAPPAQIAGRTRPLLLAAALALGVLIGHSWAALRALSDRARTTPPPD